MNSTDIPAPVHTRHDGATSPLRRAVEILAGLHALTGLAGLGVAVWAYVATETSTSEDPLVGLGYFVAAGAALGGLGLLVLGVGCLRARRTTATHVLGLATALWSGCTIGLGAIWIASTALSLIWVAATLALLVLAVVGLATEQDRA